MSDRIQDYLRYRVEQGAVHRWGENWWAEPERGLRLQTEMDVICGEDFASYFLILTRILDFCREQEIVYGPGRGSVGGSTVAYVLGIHELDPIKWGLSFERFMNKDRIAYPDVDIDVSQRHRGRVLQFIQDEFEDEHTVVLQVAAFARAGARRTIDMVAAAKSQTEPDAYAMAEQLKRLLPEGANVTGGTKQEHEIAWWLENSKNNTKREKFEKLAEQMGWLDLLLQLDGIQTHLAKHAAGVVILSREDLARLPLTGAQDTQSGQWRMMTGYDMYSLDELKYLKIDILGLRTLDIVSDAHIFCGGDGTTPELIKLWERERADNNATYDLLCEADTTGVFQVETSGYRKTLKEFQPRSFDHIAHLNALYRPGALDSRRPDGKNMVEVYIERLHHREPVTYPMELADALRPILDVTQGIILYQEQAMAIAVQLSGFSAAQADTLRKAIGKKMGKLMDSIKADFVAGMASHGYSPEAANNTWEAIAAAARYSWNKSHAHFYGLITWLCAYFKANPQVTIPDLGLDGPGKAAFYASLINSLDENKERQADAIAEARQHVDIRPPNVNVAQASYTIDDGAIVFGLNGIKGMGEANRDAILLERLIGGPFQSFADFHKRLPSVPINMKLSLIRCGAFDSVELRTYLLAQGQCRDKKGQPVGKVATMAELIKHNSGLKKPRTLPNITDLMLPTERALADGEIETIGFYVSADPMADVNQALKRLDPSKHWGGQIESIKIFQDRNGNEMVKFTLLTPALNKQRCMVFASNWPQCKHLVFKGSRIIVRGYMDGTQVIGEALFAAGDYRHFKVIKLSQNGTNTVAEFDGELSTVESAEADGYTVQLL